MCSVISAFLTQSFTLPIAQQLIAMAASSLMVEDATTDGTDACLRGVFQTGISRVKVRIPCDLGYESWSQKIRVPEILVGENRMILRLLVWSRYQRVCQTDGHAAYGHSRSRIAERDKKHGSALRSISIYFY